MQQYCLFSTYPPNCLPAPKQGREVEVPVSQAASGAADVRLFTAARYHLNNAKSVFSGPLYFKTCTKSSGTPWYLRQTPLLLCQGPCELRKVSPGALLIRQGKAKYLPAHLPTSIPPFITAFDCFPPLRPPHQHLCSPSHPSYQRLKLSCPSTILTMAADIGQIAQLLNATLDPAQHRKGTLVMFFHGLPLPRDIAC